MTANTISDAEYAAALVAGRDAQRTEFRAQSVSYLPECDALQIMTVRNGGFVVPRALIGALQGVAPADRSKLELWPDGSLIEIEHLDIHIAVDGVIRAALPVLVPAGTFPPAAGATKTPSRPRLSVRPKRSAA